MIRYLHEHDHYLAFLVERREETKVTGSVEAEKLEGLEKHPNVNGMETLVVEQDNEQEGQTQEAEIEEGPEETNERSDTS